MTEQKINREWPDVHEADIGMMSTAIHYASWGQVEDGPYAGYAEGVSLSMDLTTHLEHYLGVEDDDFATEVYDAVQAVLDTYRGCFWTGDSAEFLSVEFGLAYADNETPEEMTQRITRETGFMKLYNDAVLFDHFTRKIAERLGYLVVDDDSMGRWIKPDPEGAWYVVDTWTVTDDGSHLVLARFATEEEGSLFIATLPDVVEGRYGLDGPAEEAG